MFDPDVSADGAEGPGGDPLALAGELLERVGDTHHRGPQLHPTVGRARPGQPEKNELLQLLVKLIYRRFL